MGSFYQLESELAKLQMLGKTSSNKYLQSKNLETENSVHDNEDTEKMCLGILTKNKCTGGKNNTPEQKTVLVCLVNCRRTVFWYFQGMMVAGG